MLHDSLRIASGIRSGGSMMTVTFRLYSDDQCQTQVGEDETVDLQEQANGAGAAATEDGVLVDVGPTYYWRAQLSGNDYNEGFTTGCRSERVDLTFTDAAQ